DPIASPFVYQNFPITASAQAGRAVANMTPAACPSPSSSVGTIGTIFQNVGNNVSGDTSCTSAVGCTVSFNGTGVVDKANNHTDYTLSVLLKLPNYGPTGV